MSHLRIVQNCGFTLFILWAIIATGCDSASTGANANANKRPKREVPPPSSQALAASETERRGAERARQRMLEQQASKPADGEADATPTSDPHVDRTPIASPDAASTPSSAPIAPPDTTPGATVKTLKFDAPAGWKSQPPSRPTRLAEYDLSADAAAGTTTAVLTAFPARGAMAELEPNLQRWMASFMAPDGEKLSREAVEVSEKTVNDLKVIVVKMSGRFLAPPSMGGDGKLTDDVQRMVMLMVPTPEKVYFLRVQGPEAAVKAAEAGIDTMVSSLRVE